MSLILYCRSVPLVQETSEILNLPFRIVSEDFILVKEMEGVFGTFFVSEDNKQSDVQLELVIREESQRPLRNICYSLLGLTMLYYGSMETSSELNISYMAKNGSLVMKSLKNLETKESIWAPMPFYIGTGSTLAAPLFNSNRYPSHLRKYCLEEDPGNMRSIFEQSKEQNCQEYSNFIKLLFLQNQDQIRQTLSSIQEHL